MSTTNGVHSHHTGQQFIVYLDQNGSFPNSYEKQYIVHANDSVTITLDSSQLEQKTPILLTNYPEFDKTKNSYIHPIAPEFTESSNMTIQESELLKKYKIFTGFYNSEGSWQVDLQIQDFDGSLFLQVIFIQGDYLPGQKDPLVIKNFGAPEWLMIQPRLTVNKNHIGMDQIIIQTVLPFSLGHSSKWLEILKTQTNLGYNGFHFPPIQKLGFSGSYYSINDQLKANPDLFDQNEKEPFAAMKKIVNTLETEMNALSFVDILLNHTSFDSEWLLQLPEAVYNPENTPQLAVALELDEAIQNFSDKLATHQVKEYYNGSNRIENEEQLSALIEIMKNKIFYGMKLEEFFLLDKQAISTKFQEAVKGKGIKLILKELDVDDDENIFSRSGFDILNAFIKQNTSGLGSKRYGASLDISKLIETEISKQPNLFSLEAFERALTHFNQTWMDRFYEYTSQAVESTRGQIRYWHIELGRYEVTNQYSLVPRYFTKMSNGRYAANNGWIMNYDPLKNFADDQEFHYYRRTICIWGDLIKLRYGSTKKDSPGLWKRMKKYIQEMAKVFHGFRLDNAHSTPLHVGEYFMRKARNVNKNLMIFAELFTGNGQKDAIFCKRMGINALVRELNHNRNPLDLYHNLHWLSRSQESSVGSLPRLFQFDFSTNQKKTHLVPTQTKSIVYDQTHDNESTLSIFSHQQTVPLIALTSFSHFVQGTVRGFDELYPEKLSVVSERRKYQSQLDCTQTELDNVPIEVGIVATLNFSTESIELKGSWDNWTTGIKMNHHAGSHEKGVFQYLAKFQVPSANTSYEYKYIIDGKWTVDENKPIKNENNYFDVPENAKNLTYYNNLCLLRKTFIDINQTLNKHYPFIFYSHYDYGFISVMRETYQKDQYYFLISRTALCENDSKVNIDIECPGIIQSIEGIYSASDSIDVDGNRVKNHEMLTGLKTKIYKEFNLLKYGELKFNQQTMKHTIHFFNAPPSLSIVIKCTLHATQKQGIERLNYMLSHIQDDEILALYKPLKTEDINYLFFSSEQEEHERSGYGMFNIPNKGNLLFGGLAGVFKDVNEACQFNDLGKPLFVNLREGYWYLDYIINRLNKYEGNLTQITGYIQSYFDLLKVIPKYLIPHYFSQFIMQIQLHAHKIISSKLKGEALKLSSSFHKNLLFANYQFLSVLPSTHFDDYSLSMAAGLPHFTTGWARCWGRDTFISLRGTLLIPGLYEEAKQIICMFASTLRHGLIPNLLDNGRSPRYNCRDACWWFVKGVKDYIQFTNDTQILKKEIKMRFLSDDYMEHYEKEGKGQVKKMLLQDIIFEIFQKHAKGIHFREWKAGWEIDTNMDTEGFNIHLKLDEQTGFILGGNMRNCLTWMDKMGSSTKAGNKGIPATSRDGAPIEMTAILKCCLDFVNSCPEFPYKEVETASGKKLTFRQWGSLISANFEKCYWIPNKLPSMDNMSDKLFKYITRKGIYKDLYNSSIPRCDFQLRPNACIAIALAPELFTPQNALFHLATVEGVLIEQNSLGVKTLDKLAQEYVPYYDNSDDGIQPKTAHGFCYHNGPEWVWMYGYFLKALLEINRKVPQFTKEKLMSYLANHKRHIIKSEWLSLPEMTNQNGEYNNFSCQSQAWSIATLVEVCYDSIQLPVKALAK
ncbi:hypothetical protein ABPG74_018046 [Tetrahymena malaccensis]